MRQSFPYQRAIRLLAEAERILAQGGIEADVCRRLGVSHVVYKRLRDRFSTGVSRPPG